MQPKMYNLKPCEWWTRYEHQCRNSIHAHSFRWLDMEGHSEAPNLSCLRRILEEVQAMQAESVGAGEGECSADVYGCGDLSQADLARLMTTRAQASDVVQECALWYADHIDSSNSFWDSAKRVATRVEGGTHPCDMNPLHCFASEGADVPPGFVPPEATVITSALLDKMSDDYDKISTKTRRHTLCNSSCLKFNKQTKTQYCRFEEKLAVRTDKNTDKSLGPHFFALPCNGLFQWHFYPGPKEDPRINSTGPLEQLFHRSNTDKKPVIDVIGTVQYTTKAAGYATKREKRGQMADGALSYKASRSDPSRSMPALMQATICAILDRDYSA